MCTVLWIFSGYGACEGLCQCRDSIAPLFFRFIHGQIGDFLDSHHTLITKALAGDADAGRDTE